MQKTLKKRRSGGYDKSREVTEMAYQKDISAILGVSVATVSKALKGYSDVSEKTRRKVLQTAEAIDYRYGGWNCAERPSKKCGAVGIMTSGFEKESPASPFLKSMVLGMMEEAIRKERDVVVMDGKSEPGQLSRVGKIVTRRVDGVCILLEEREIYKGRYADLLESRIPVVSVEVPVAGHTSVCTDFRENTHILLMHLKERGHRKTALIGDLSLEHKKAVTVVADEAGKLGMSCVCADASGFMDPPVDRSEGGALPLPFSDDITCAIFRTEAEASEYTAKWRQKGLLVPRDISAAVLELEHGDGVKSRFTGVRRSPEQIGRIAVRVLVRVTECPESDSGERIVVAGEVVDMGTVRDLYAQAIGRSV